MHDVGGQEGQNEYRREEYRDPLIFVKIVVSPRKLGEQIFNKGDYRSGDIKEIVVKSGGKAFLGEKYSQHRNTEMNFDGLIKLNVNQKNYHEYGGQHNGHYLVGSCGTAEKGQREEYQDVDYENKEAEVSQPAYKKISGT